MQSQIQIWWFHIKEWLWSSCSRGVLPASGKGVPILFSVAPPEYSNSKKGRDVPPSLVFRSLLRDCSRAKYTDLHLVSVTHGKMCSLSSGRPYEVSLQNKEWSSGQRPDLELQIENNCWDSRGVQLPQWLNAPHWVDTEFAQDGFRDDLEEFFGYFCA